MWFAREVRHCAQAWSASEADGRKLPEELFHQPSQGGRWATGNSCGYCSLSESAGAGEELVNRFVNFLRSVDIGEVPRFSQDDEAGTGYGLSDVGRAFHGNKIIVSVENERPRTKLFEPRNNREAVRPIDA